jgi:hypothetical protein
MFLSIIILVFLGLLILNTFIRIYLNENNEDINIQSKFINTLLSFTKTSPILNLIKMHQYKSKNNNKQQVRLFGGNTRIFRNI